MKMEFVYSLESKACLEKYLDDEEELWLRLSGSDMKKF